MDFHASPASFLFSPVRSKIASFILHNKFPMSEREISRLLSVSHMSVNRAMRDLEAMNLVNKVRVGTAFLWKANKASYAYKAFSEVHSALSNIRNPLDELKADIIKALPTAKIAKIVLYGSIAKKKEKPGSDIDLYVLAKSRENKAEVERALDRLGILCLEKYGHPLSPYLRTPEEISPGEHLKLHREISSGIVIYPFEPGK